MSKSLKSKDIWSFFVLDYLGKSKVGTVINSRTRMKQVPRIWAYPLAWGVQASPSNEGELEALGLPCCHALSVNITTTDDSWGRKQPTIQPPRGKGFGVSSDSRLRGWSWFPGGTALRVSCIPYWSYLVAGSKVPRDQGLSETCWAEIIITLFHNMLNSL